MGGRCGVGYGWFTQALLPERTRTNLRDPTDNTTAGAGGQAARGLHDDTVEFDAARRDKSLRLAPALGEPGLEQHVGHALGIAQIEIR